MYACMYLQYYVPSHAILEWLQNFYDSHAFMYNVTDCTCNFFRVTQIGFLT